MQLSLPLPHQVILLFIVLLVLSLVSSIGASVWNKINGTGHWYLQLDTGEPLYVGHSISIRDTGTSN